MKVELAGRVGVYATVSSWGRGRGYKRVLLAKNASDVTITSFKTSLPAGATVFKGLAVRRTKDGAVKTGAQRWSRTQGDASITILSRSV
jgi:hypothetical protein